MKAILILLTIISLVCDASPLNPRLKLKFNRPNMKKIIRDTTFNNILESNKDYIEYLKTQKIFINNQEYKIFEIEGNFQVFKSVSQKEKEEVFKKLKAYEKTNQKKFIKGKPFNNILEKNKNYIEYLKIQKIFINDQGYQTFEIEESIQVFKSVEKKEKKEVLKKLKEDKKKIIGEIDKMLQEDDGRKHMIFQLPPCEIFNKEQMELFTVLELQVPKSNKLICKPNKDVICLDLKEDANSSENNNLKEQKCKHFNRFY